MPRRENKFDLKKTLPTRWGSKLQPGDNANISFGSSRASDHSDLWNFSPVKCFEPTSPPPPLNPDPGTFVRRISTPDTVLLSGCNDRESDPEILHHSSTPDTVILTSQEDPNGGSEDGDTFPKDTSSSQEIWADTVILSGGNGSNASHRPTSKRLRYL